MSYLICGSFILNEDLNSEKHSRLAFEFLNCALKNRLYIQLGFTICQKLVFEILNQQHTDQKNNYLFFYITGSPLHNVSDSLISPYIGNDQNYIFRINEVLNKLRAFLEETIDNDLVKSIELIFSEGYDENYQIVNLKSNDLMQIDSTYFEPESDVPSIKFIIEK